MRGAISRGSCEEMCSGASTGLSDLSHVRSSRRVQGQSPKSKNFKPRVSENCTFWAHSRRRVVYAHRHKVRPVSAAPSVAGEFGPMEHLAALDAASREAHLETLKRPELQNLAKEVGLKVTSGALAGRWLARGFSARALALCYTQRPPATACIVDTRMLPAPEIPPIPSADSDTLPASRPTSSPWRSSPTCSQHSPPRRQRPRRGLLWGQRQVCPRTLLLPSSGCADGVPARCQTIHHLALSTRRPSCQPRL